jgi:hypothetical protein
MFASFYDVARIEVLSGPQELFMDATQLGDP